MGPDLELQGNLKAAMEFSVSKDNVIASEGSEEKLLQRASNCEDNTFGVEGLLVERAGEHNGIDNMELNITDIIDTIDAVPVEGECQDVTEHSSSFGGTESRTESGLMLTDDEIESHVCASNASVFDGCFDAFRIRKKKLTVHWRQFIRPLMWRCKWIELQIKELQSQALKYDRELAVYDQRKQFEFENFTLEGFDAKSLPFSRQLRNKVMARKKRKRVEETADVTPYISQHNLFSYYESKRSIADGAPIEGYCGNLDKIANGSNEFGLNDGWSSLEFGNGDNSLEQILSKIEVAHSQVRKLKTQIDKVLSENPGKFCSINKLSFPVPSEALTISDQSPASPPDNGHRLPAKSRFTSRHISEGSMGDVPMSENAVFSLGEANPLSNIIESIDQSQKEGILIHNQAAKEELDGFGQVRGWLIEKPQVPLEEQKTIPDLPAETATPKVQSNVKSRSPSKSSFPRHTRRRGRRKAGSKRWSRRSLG
ncbi:hypothetical protein I3843_02G118500 [Carya illinoinensis]|uniref:Uncharacterized protein n=1 Tax=Carya illinoinensis TaxID=32201 RepID=A0A922FSK2_CARIL|nr:uncharacterized protein LOC122300953 isoform X1 [Carya illinoinensis]XP_042967901.1 uncharacterized protein LOC122300953 isoform X1 [Carya illinoinensis]XP_042967902.1 uncharacterized protein LOC122300953 isoform X1 [Carya illinoinensis]XP_042967903.1 uncharacterized protein LOC122300953 isoform X1 [Carya illinoinensis]XP_042967904.1 uncharacterized protein LOC122300953 isoform X1 [Carya illinoinensis]XP_042967905.1 uncharacterized protein LOC122300953 isoform X1 [Carya illinoinensis]XP_04